MTEKMSKLTGDNNTVGIIIEQVENGEARVERIDETVSAHEVGAPIVFSKLIDFVSGPMFVREPERPTMVVKPMQLTYKNVALLLDASISMGGVSVHVFEKLLLATNEFRAKIAIAQPAMEMHIFHFSSTVVGPVVQPITDTINGWSFANGTALLDAVRRALDVDSLASIVVMTDGEENASKCDRMELETKLAKFKADGGRLVMFGPRYPTILDKYITDDERLTQEHTQSGADFHDGITHSMGDTNAYTSVSSSALRTTNRTV